MYQDLVYNHAYFLLRIIFVTSTPQRPHRNITALIAKVHLRHERAPT
jgi:hypothetical protein